MDAGKLWETAAAMAETAAIGGDCGFWGFACVCGCDGLSVCVDN